MAESVPRAATRNRSAWEWILGHNFCAKKQSVHARHLKIQDDDVRTELLHLCIAKMDSAATVTLMFAFLGEQACMTWRTTAESSTTST